MITRRIQAAILWIMTWMLAVWLANQFAPSDYTVWVMLWGNIAMWICDRVERAVLKTG